MKSTTRFLLCAVAALAAPTVVRAAVLTVTNTADDGSPGCLRQCIADAQPGDEIEFDPHLHVPAIRLASGQPVTDGDLTITGRRPDDTTAHGNREDRLPLEQPFKGGVALEVFTSDGDLELSGEHVFASFVLQEGHTLTVPRGEPLRLIAGKIVIAGLLDATDAGYRGGHTDPEYGDRPRGEGPGGGGGGFYYAGGGGGAHGGDGGNANRESHTSEGRGGLSYGSADGEEVELGSGGGWAMYLEGGDGGGAVTLIAGRLLVIGAVQADGQDAPLLAEWPGGGGGAGGTVLIQAQEVINNGVVSARGGRGGGVITEWPARGGGGGGGGRIKLYYQTKFSDHGALLVQGGAAGDELPWSSRPAQPGQPGTIHVEQVATLPFARPRHPEFAEVADRRASDHHEVDSLRSGTGSSMASAVSEAPSNAITVCSTGCDHTSIQDAVDAAGVEATILLGSEVFAESVRIEGKTLTLLGQGPDRSVLRGNGIDTVVSITGTTSVALVSLAVEDGGRGVYNEAGPLTLEDCVVRNNHRDGGVVSRGPTTLIDCEIHDNERLHHGGGVMVFGNLTMRHSVVRNNRQNEGGAILTGGGGISVFGAADIVGSTLVDNFAGDEGGAVFVAGAMRIYRTTISGNWGGGVVHACLGFPALVESSTIANNVARGLELVDLDGYGCDVVLTGVTLTGNTAGLRVPPWALPGIRMDHTIIAENELAQCEGEASVFSSRGHNLSSDRSCGLTEPSDLLFADPMLGPLQDNYGPTWTRLPLEGSPVIDRGWCDRGTDQRGVPRPIDGNLDNVWLCDIGAVEYVPYCDTPDRPCDDRKVEIPGPLGGEVIVFPPDGG